MAKPAETASIVHLLPGRVRLHIPQLRRNPSLSGRLGAVLRGHPGVAHAVADVVTGHILVRYDTRRLHHEDVLGLVDRAAGETSCLPGTASVLPVRLAARQVLLTGTALVAIGLKRAVAGPSALAGSWLTYDLAGLVTVVASYPYLRRGIGALFGQGRVNGDLLIGTAGLGALLLRENLLGLGVLFLSGLNQFMLARTVREAEENLGALQIPQPEPAQGEVIPVRAGMVIPADGKAVAGWGLADRSLLTGAAAWLAIGPGDPVQAGDRLAAGELQVRVTAVGDGTRRGGILRAERKDPAAGPGAALAECHQRQATRWGLWAMVAAVLTGLLTRDWRRALAALIAAAPAAVRLAAPLPLAAAAAAAARRGILLRDTGAVAAAGQVDTVLFDKTGTLTTGWPRVARVLPAAPGGRAAELLTLAGAAERRHRVGVGGERLMAEAGALDPDAAALCKPLHRQGCAAIYVAQDGRIIGVIGLRDGLRPGARESVRELRRLGIERLGMITGDHPAPARAIARALELDWLRSAASPEEKAQCIRSLQAAGRQVAFVGDGANDAPGLAAADLGLVLCHGQPVPPVRAADACLADLRAIPWFLRLGRRARTVSQQNRAFAAALNAAGLALAATGLLSPLGASLWHNLTSLAIVCHSNRVWADHV